MMPIKKTVFLTAVAAGIWSLAGAAAAGGDLQPTPAGVPYGSRIQRTMRLLGTSTPERHKKVRILIYGQSISCGPWCAAIEKKLKADFPNADLEIENRAIGGFGAGSLIATAEADLYPFYPDLVIFHVYGGNDDGGPGKMCTLEKLYRNLRTRTTAEMLTLTHHVAGKDAASRESLCKLHDTESEAIRRLAGKYGYEVADIRPDWKNQVAAHGGRQMDFLVDGTHLNAQGHELMARLVAPHLKFNPGQQNDWREMVKVYAADGKRAETAADDFPRQGEIVSKPLKFQFAGNRVDLVAMPVSGAQAGTAKILVDGKAPSTLPGIYAATRASTAPNCWWPALTRIEIGRDAAPVAEEWTLTLTKVTTVWDFEYELKGSVTGPDGAGNSKEQFTSKSGRMLINPLYFTIGPAFINFKGAPKPGFEVKWRVVANGVDTWRPNPLINPAREDRTTVVQGIANSPHTLEIIPNGDGPVGLRAIVVYQPPVKE